MKNGLTISEHFYSIQGEGITMGVPSVFLRLTACNLLCDKDWICDTIEVWRTGKQYEIGELVNILIDNYSLQLIRGAHLIITGGEPLLQFKALEPFIELLTEQLGSKPFIEIETNGTITPKGKLFNSGEPEQKRIKINTLQFYSLTPKSIFKFVVSRIEDLQEIYDIIEQANIPRNKVYLMPSAQDQKELDLNTKLVSNICLENNYNFSTRLQIIIWNETTGV